MRTVLPALLCLAALVEAPAQTTFARNQGPELFTYQELLQLSEADDLDPMLAEKLRTLTTTPFVDNTAWLEGERPHAPQVPGLGKTLRVVHWNIARGIRLTQIIELFTDPDAFADKVLEAKGRRLDVSLLLEEIDTIRAADLLVLNEVDWGLKRSDYRVVVRELAQALGMNWAFGAEFIEVDPKQLGTEQFEEVENEEERLEMVAKIAVDESRLRAVHGTAVLSRYPIVEARLIPFETIGYDWLAGERRDVSRLEEGKRVAAGRVFLENVSREVRRGGRTCLYVTLDMPELEEGKLTVAAPHLENRTKSENRVEQMREVLEHLAQVDNPAIIAGDLNTTGSDTSPTSLKREVYRTLGSSNFWANKGIKYATGVGLAYDVLAGGASFLKNYNDPTAEHVPVVAPNPEEALFELIKTWRFGDGTTLDLRGDPERSVDAFSGTLANSNERQRKGFEPTYAVERTIGPTGRFKLDWILVKDYIEDPRDVKQTYRFAPHFARTMSNLNYALEERLSDHSPISADLPFDEPGKLEKRGKKRLWPF